MKLYFAIIAISLLVSQVALYADGPKDNIAATVRPMPPPGNELSPQDRDALQAGVDSLSKEIQALKTELKDKPESLKYLPDIQIFEKAVRYPLAYHETIDPKAGLAAIAQGLERARQLRGGNKAWTSVSGPRGYVSAIDDSVQPYFLEIPVTYSLPGGRFPSTEQFRLDASFHGRDELLTELRFIQQKASQPRDKFVLQLYGRYCNANKFAGEIDCLEAMDAVEQMYRIDKNRLLAIGFSMGGAACWEFAVHYTDRWAAASPGAGFAETKQFLKVFQNEQVGPPWYEQALWHLYDCTDYAGNLFNLPTIAYAGEIDPQKQASDVMLEAMAKEGLTLQRIIGPNTKHAYEKNAKIELDKRLDDILAKGRNPVPAKVRFTTWTLRYNHMYWVHLDGLEKHWDRARADAEIVDGAIEAKTQNVTAMTFAFEEGQCPFPAGSKPMITIDGTKLEAAAVSDGKALSASFIKAGGVWKLADQKQPDEALSKRHGLQGPIDDAFMERFMIVRPTGKPLNEKVGAWEKAECDHAIEHWRSQFRGDARVKDDDQVTDADRADGNLVLFGDPSSNKLIARLAGKLPIQWSADGVKVGSQSFSADHHVPVLIYPNPLSPKHYVVLNSGFTYREYDYLNNARQVPKLPDYAVVDVDVARTSRAPGGIVNAGFFGEKWELLPDDGKR